ncbi:endonuclease/exonuclease/phosphatase family protein [Acrocarpospora catenulata]|uniref:endonuclease/exonuclease/phosphatase family protein n=1 Tax=Acrocarpospora catenulata TaxID=2836182 RepID=UPI001BD9D3BA|nr:endonuclease/exonuclease/phosphatase family protein [Acrocarpospora catenulata]
MKVMTLNVLVGGENRFGDLLTIIAAARPDVLVLQECVGWEDGARLRAVAETMGVQADGKHTIVGVANARSSGRRYNVCVVSRAPILRRRVHTPPTLAHCIVEAELAWPDAEEPLLLLGTHLVYSDEDSRLAEVEELLKLAPPERLAARPCVLAGDLNALDRDDPYPADLDHRLTAAGMHKYGHPPRFEVMDRLHAAGWVDALRTLPRSHRWVTARRNRGSATVDTRTDYILLSPPLAPRLAGAEVIDVGSASDHHALAAELS